MRSYAGAFRNPVAISWKADAVSAGSTWLQTKTKIRRELTARKKNFRVRQETAGGREISIDLVLIFFLSRSIGLPSY